MVNIKNIRKALIISLIAILTTGIVLFGTGCTNKEPVTKEGYYLDTICQITIYNMKDMSEKNAEKAIEGAFDTCEKYENMLSKTRKESDIYKINHGNSQPVKCNEETIEVIKKGIHYGEISDGLFDITVGKETDLWNFHDEKPKVPDEKELQDAVTHVGYEKIHIDGDRVWLDDSEAEIDLGGIAKGYISDRVAEYLEKNGVESAIINLGGNISVVGYKDKDKTPFKIGIKKPFDKEGKILGTVELDNGTIVTSGIYERCFKENGKLYHHILNPENGYPVNSGIEAVTIEGGKGKSCDCDAMATICLLMGEEKGKKFIESQKGYEALFVDDNGKITMTKGMKSFKPE